MCVCFVHGWMTINNYSPNFQMSNNVVLHSVLTSQVDSKGRSGVLSWSNSVFYNRCIKTNITILHICNVQISSLRNTDTLILNNSSNALSPSIGGLWVIWKSVCQGVGELEALVLGGYNGYRNSRSTCNCEIFVYNQKIISETEILLQMTHNLAKE